MEILRKSVVRPVVCSIKSIVSIVCQNISDKKATIQLKQLTLERLFLFAFGLFGYLVKRLLI